MTSYQLRAVRDDDADMMVALYAQGNGADLAALPMPAEQKQQMLSMQAAAQVSGYRAQYPNADWSVIEVAGEWAGRVIVDRSPAEIRIVDLALDGRLQSKGVGSAVLQSLVDEAEDQGVPLRFSVRATNERAISLYERLGFVVAGSDDGIYCAVERMPTRGLPPFG